MLRIYDVIIDTVRGLRPVMETIGKHDPDLVKQMRRALASVPLNVAEGSASRGGNRLARYHNAAGSMREVGAAIDVAVALGYIDDPGDDFRDRVGRIVGTLMKNARPR